MVTEPIQGVQEHDENSPLDLDVRRNLQKLGELPPSREVPYLTVSLDWRSEGTSPGREPAPEVRPSERRSTHPEAGPSRRPAKQQIEDEFDALLEAHGPRGDAFDSLKADVERIDTYLNDELDPAAQGVFIVACQAKGLFVPLALGLPMETRLATGSIPSLSQLALLQDDHPTYALLNADQKDAVLGFYSQTNLDQSISIDATGFPRKQQTGGISQRRLQARADERVAAFARGVAEETRNALDEEDVSMLIIAGDEVITSPLDDAFHQTVKDRIIGTLRLDNNLSSQEIGEAARPLVAAAERAREAEAIAKFQNGLGQGGLAAAGAKATLAALQVGQVMTLIMNDDVHLDAWADFGMQTYGVGKAPKKHPAGGDASAMASVELDELLVWLSLQTGAGVQIIHTDGPISASELDEIPDAGQAPPRSEPAMALDDHGGIGALLRYS